MATVSKPHVFKYRFIKWLYCHHCGLVLLNNTASRKEACKPCGPRNVNGD